MSGLIFFWMLPSAVRNFLVNRFVALRGDTPRSLRVTEQPLYEPVFFKSESPARIASTSLLSLLGPYIFVNLGLYSIHWLVLDFTQSSGVKYHTLVRPCTLICFCFALQYTPL